MTGLAQPNTGAPMTASRMGKMMVPKISIWAMGLSETRPCSLAVGSPHLSALQAWADSWTDMAKSTAANWITMRKISFII